MLDFVGALLPRKASRSNSSSLAKTEPAIRVAVLGECTALLFVSLLGLCVGSRCVAKIGSCGEAPVLST